MDLDVADLAAAVVPEVRTALLRGMLTLAANG